MSFVFWEWSNTYWKGLIVKPSRMAKLLGVGLDPHRVLASGEKLSEAKERMWAVGGAGRMGALSRVSKLVRGGFSYQEAEDFTYGEEYSFVNYPWPEGKRPKRLVKGFKSLDELLREDGTR